MQVFQLFRCLASSVRGRIIPLMNRIRKRDIYVKENGSGLPWAFVSYIPYVLHEKKQYRLFRHQNQREMFRIVSVFSELGYNVYVMEYSSKRNLPDIDVRVVFGLDPVLQRASKKYINACKIYYATGAYYTHQTPMVKRMTDEFNEFFNSHIPYRRLVAPHNSCQIADKILMIGSKYTIETYPLEVRNKIDLIHQSTQQSIVISDIKFAKENEFVFMASGGNALKGVGLLVKYFSEHTDYTINVIGPIERDVMKAIRKFLTPNIKLHGFMNVNDGHFLSILNRCNFLIYPSGSEGSPGAVLNLMKNGMIPIVSRWAAFDEVNDFGYMLENVNLHSIDSAVKWANGLKNEDVLVMKKKVKQYTEETYNLDRFTSELKTYLMSLK